MEEQEADRRIPLSEETVNRFLAELATAEHYARILETVNRNPRASLAENLLGPGQELSEEAHQAGYK